MDDQSRQPLEINQQQTKQPETPTAPGPITHNQDHKTKLNISDEQAQALLAINNLQRSPPKQHTRAPVGLLITLATIVVLVIVASVILSNIKPGSNTTTTTSGSSTPSSSSSSEKNDGTTNQINQDVNGCSNPLTAISQC